MTGVYAVAAAAIGPALFRRVSTPTEVARLLGSKRSCDVPTIAAPLG